MLYYIENIHTKLGKYTSKRIASYSIEEWKAIYNFYNKHIDYRILVIRK